MRNLTPETMHIELRERIDRAKDKGFIVLPGHYGSAGDTCTGCLLGAVHFAKTGRPLIASGGLGPLSDDIRINAYHQIIGDILDISPEEVLDLEKGFEYIGPSRTMLRLWANRYEYTRYPELVELGWEFRMEELADNYSILHGLPPRPVESEVLCLS